MKLQPPSPDAERVNSALAASSASLLLAVGCVAMFLPPLAAATLGSVLRTVAVSLVLATSLLLHWVFLAIAAGRMQRSRFGWVSLSVLLFPVGSAASLILLNWFSEDRLDSGALAPAPYRG
jgi:hypothetical protein